MKTKAMRRCPRSQTLKIRLSACSLPHSTLTTGRPSPHAPRRSRFEDLSSKPRTRKNSNARELPQRPAGASLPSANGWNRSTTTLAACIKAISWRPSSLAEKFSIDLHRMHHSVFGVPRRPPRSEEPPSIGLTDTSLCHTEDYLGIYSQIPCLVSQSNNFSSRQLQFEVFQN
ncbi:hypothetical protein TNCV_3438501 [Trichonephila clavipes]|nr:hypothetical protein TNCV_3438501 [Trichonephila clavipes]